MVVSCEVKNQIGLAAPLCDKFDHLDDDIGLDEDVMERQVSIESRQIEILGGTSMFSSVLLLIQAIIGGGLLAFPSAFKNGGILDVLLIQFVMMGFITLGLWILAWGSERTGADSFQGLVRDVLGRRWETFTAILSTVYIFGSAVVYVDIFVDQTHPWVQAYMSRSTATVVTSLSFSLLVLGRTMASLALPALLGSLALLYVFVLIVANFSLGALRGPIVGPGGEPVMLRLGVQEWLSALPIVCFSYQGHISAVAQYAELSKRSLQRWGVVLLFGLGATVIVYNLTGLMAYIQFGDRTANDILTSFLAGGPELAIPMAFVSCARLAVGIKVGATFAVYTFCARSAILDGLGWLGGPSSSSAAFYGVTYAWVALLALVAVLAPDIGKVMSVVGNAACFFMFECPGQVLLKVAREEKAREHRGTTRWRQAGGWALIVVGRFVFIVGLVNSLITF